MPHTLTSHTHSGLYLLLPITPPAHLPPSEHTASPAACPYRTLATTGACGNTTYVLGLGPAKTPSSERTAGAAAIQRRQATSHPPHATFLPTPHPTHPAPTAPEAGAHPAGLQAMAAHSLGEAPSPRYSRCLISVDPSVQSGCLFSH